VNDPTPRSRSLLQYSVAFAVIAVLLACLFNALHDVQEQAERTVMEANIRNMDSGLRIEVASRVIHGQEATIKELVGANPVQWLQGPPVGYTGICRMEQASGQWCFDSTTQEIVYRPKIDRHLEYLEPPGRGLRWRVSSSAEIAGKRMGKLTSAGPIRLYSTTSFAWH
jgi:hypothetical protein